MERAIEQYRLKRRFEEAQLDLVRQHQLAQEAAVREQLINAAMVPQQLQHLKPSGSADPNAPLRRRLGLE